VSLEIEVVDDPARACAAMLVGAAARGGHIALAGGSTPRAAYHEFVSAVQAGSVDLSATTFWFGDERCVAPEDERSNFRMVNESLLGPLGDLCRARVMRIKGELGPQGAADDYDRRLREAGPPEFELVLLGLGPDGHTASLFPDQESLSIRTRLAFGVSQAGLEPFVPRVTLTLPALAASRRVVFLAAGAAKAQAVRAAFAPGAPPDPHVPASLVVPEARAITVLLDGPAAQELEGMEQP
jgi:6-phosphogluconolactonase